MTQEINMGDQYVLYYFDKRFQYAYDTDYLNAYDRLQDDGFNYRTYAVLEDAADPALVLDIADSVSTDANPVADGIAYTVVNDPVAIGDSLQITAAQTEEYPTSAGAIGDECYFLLFKMNDSTDGTLMLADNLTVNGANVEIDEVIPMAGDFRVWIIGEGHVSWGKHDFTVS